jgi:hypothetical protein
MVKLTWMGTHTPLETKVTRADATKVLEYNDTRWELEAFGGGTRLTLWHNIERRFISWGAAGWQRLNAEYAKQFGVETPGWPPQAAQPSRVVSEPG